jgi:poly(hydroxyalkanoate) granule-associated protein
MAEEIEIVEEEESLGTTPFISTIRRILMAGVGAVVLAQEEVEEFVQKLVERGELAEQDGRKLVTDLREKRQSAQKSTQERVQETGATVDRGMEGMLGRMNIPTKSDIETLSEKIAALSEKVDELKAQNEA